MKKINKIFGFIMGLGVLLSSCTGDLDQMPVIEDTADDIYSSAAN